MRVVAVNFAADHNYRRGAVLGQFERHEAIAISVEERARFLVDGHGTSGPSGRHPGLATEHCTPGRGQRPEASCPNPSAPYPALAAVTPAATWPGEAHTATSPAV